MAQMLMQLFRVHSVTSATRSGENMNTNKNSSEQSGASTDVPFKFQKIELIDLAYRGCLIQGVLRLRGQESGYGGVQMTRGKKKRFNVWLSYFSRIYR